MSDYNHILLLTDGSLSDDVFLKANYIANCFGARLTIGYCLPQIPLIANGAVNLESECREAIKLQLIQIGERYKIPIEDQWIVTQDENEPFLRLRKNGIDMVLVAKGIRSMQLRSQLVNKLLQQYSCSIQFINN